MDIKPSLPCLLIFTLVVSFTIACLSKILAVVTAFAICMILFIGSGNINKKSLLNIGRANIFIIFLWLITPFTTPGEIIHKWHFMEISMEGCRLCVLLTLKAEAIILLFIALLGKKSLFEFGEALTVLKCPRKLVWLFILMDRNVYILQKEFKKLHASLKLRAFTPHTNLYTYSTYATLLGLFLLQAHKKGHLLHEAMLLSGYNGKLPFDKTWHMKKSDFLLLVLGCFLAGLLLFQNIYL